MIIFIQQGSRSERRNESEEMRVPKLALSPIFKMGKIYIPIFIGQDLPPPPLHTSPPFRHSHLLQFLTFRNSRFNAPTQLFFNRFTSPNTGCLKMIPYQEMSTTLLQKMVSVPLQSFSIGLWIIWCVSKYKSLTQSPKWLTWKSFSWVFKRGLGLFFPNNFSRFFYFSYIFIVLCYS